MLIVVLPSGPPGWPRMSGWCSLVASMIFCKVLRPFRPYERKTRLVVMLNESLQVFFQFLLRAVDALLQAAPGQNAKRSIRLDSSRRHEWEYSGNAREDGDASRPRGKPPPRRPERGGSSPRCAAAGPAPGPRRWPS